MHQNRVFLDTNIVTDILDTKRPFYKKASKLIRILVEKEFKSAISEDMLSTICYIIKDKTSALAFLKSILNKWLILPYKTSVIAGAVDLAYERSLDLEDTLQCVCARVNGCSYFITSDKNLSHAA